MAVKFQVPEENIPMLQAHVDKINRRHRRNGFPEVKLVDHQRDAEQQMLALLEAQPVIVHNVEIVGDMPSLDGQEFVARLDILVGEDGAENVVIEHAETTASDIERRYRDHAVARACDHCGHNRKRKSVFLLRDDSGKETRVGSTCMQDYNVNGNQFARFANEIVKLKQVAKEASEGKHLDPRNMAQTVILERLVGLVLYKRKGSHWRKQPIRTLALDVARLAVNNINEPKLMSDEIETARAVIDYARNTIAQRPDLTDEQHNTIIATKYDRIPQRLPPEAARAVVYYEEEVLGIKQDPVGAWSAETGNEYAGSAGDVLNEEVEVTTIRHMRSKFGHSNYWLVKMRDTAGRDLVWFAKDADPLVARWVTGGDCKSDRIRRTITAVVQKQSYFRGQRSTQVTQVKEA